MGRVGAVGAALVALAACSTGGGARSADGDLLEQVRESGTLRVALTQANPPWNFLDESNSPAGYDVDVARELASRLGIENVEFIPSTYQNFIEGVRANRFDIVISGQAITEERKQQVDFSIPYQVNGIAIFVQADDDTIQGIADLSGRSVATSAGTTQEAFARESIPGAEVKTNQNATLGLTDLSRGGADAALVSRFQGTYLAEQNELQVKPVGPLLESEINAMTFRKDAGSLGPEVNRVINEMIEDGTITRFSQRWLAGQDVAVELRKLPA
ncbi:ABC transporter substrate-binding protein [Pseudonocardia sp. MH-G8]|nr:ABC transporter substrate-binding protein [Pseudonocardia sp. MH-G8]